MAWHCLRACNKSQLTCVGSNIKLYRQPRGCSGQSLCRHYEYRDAAASEGSVPGAAAGKEVGPGSLSLMSRVQAHFG